jgi:hypothetical protein
MLELTEACATDIRPPEDSKGSTSLSPLLHIVISVMQGSSKQDVTFHIAVASIAQGLSLSHASVLS